MDLKTEVMYLYENSRYPSAVREIGKIMLMIRDHARIWKRAAWAGWKNVLHRCFQ